jgi:hypothetical protein
VRSAPSSSTLNAHLWSASGFDLFADGNLTLDQLSKQLYQRGLRTRPSARHPAQQVSISKLARMLRDRYYLGYITYRGEEFPGRRPLIEQHLFDRVQAVLDTRATSGERRRVHHHYLKGILYCGHCHRAGTTGRMIIQHTVTRHSDEHTYFFCRNRRQGTCPAPYVNVAVAEQAVERYYATVSQQKLTGVLATPATGDTTDHSPSRPLDTVQVYRSCTNDQRRLLNHALFRRLYLADDRIADHEPWPVTLT